MPTVLCISLETPVFWLGSFLIFGQKLFLFLNLYVIYKNANIYIKNETFIYELQLV